MAAEAILQTKIIKHLASKGAYTVKVITASKAGVPDLLVCYKGLFIAIEVKAPGKLSNTSKLQDYNLEQVRVSGGRTLVVDNLADVLKFFDSLDNQI